MKTIVTAAICTVIMVLPLSASEYETKDTTIPGDDIKHLAVEIDYGTGEFKISAQDMDDIARINIEYDPQSTKVYTDYEKDGDTGYLDLKSKQRRKFGNDEDDNFWDVTLSTKYKTDIELDLAACKGEMDLGGIPLEMIVLDIGASKVNIVFDKPNPINAKEIFIDAGIADLRISKLGNADFSFMEFEGGLGKFDLDFSGKYKRKSRVKITIGLGVATIHIPSGLPVRIDADDGFLSEVDITGADIDLDDNYYESPDYDSSDIGLELKFDVGMGSIEIIFED